MPCPSPRQQPDTLRSPMLPLAMPLKLRFNITPEVKRDIENAKQNMNMYVVKGLSYVTWVSKVDVLACVCVFCVTVPVC